jgi:cellulose synthase/poly-beta-1,6-N-acetylglucosamine synthase-like glycosyltransferase
MARVSVIIPAYNDSKNLEEYGASVAMKGYPCYACYAIEVTQ